MVMISVENSYDPLFNITVLQNLAKMCKKIRKITFWKKNLSVIYCWIECLIQCWIQYDTQFNKLDILIPGNHKSPQNLVYWIAGCLGLADPCSKECEEKVIQCVDNSGYQTDLDRTKRFSQCMSVGKSLNEVFPEIWSQDTNSSYVLFPANIRIFK